MAIAIDEKYELQFSANSASATTIKTISTENDYDLDCNWNNWSAFFDWENLAGDYYNDFGDPVHYCMIEDEIQGSSNLYNLESESQETCDSVSTEMMFVDQETNGEDTKGLRLVHLLMAAAESLTGVNKSTDLARVILVRLKELVSPNDGSNMERLAAYFTDALQGLLEGAGGLHGNKHTISNGPYHNHHRDRDESHRTDMIAAFQLLQDMSPCAKFGHFTANQAILEAVAQDRRVHIVDYDIMEGIQWASLMQALVSRKDGPPGPHLRITAISRVGNGRRSMGTVQETGRRLTAFAASIGLPFSFHQCRLDSDEMFRSSALKLVKGEALIINCMLHLPHFNYRTPDSIISFLLGVKTVNPRLVTLVEEVTGSTGDGGFLGRFMDSLHHFSALYDSLEAGFPMQSRARALVERVFLGPRITNSVARIYRTGGEDEGCSWWERLGSVGFAPVNISFANHCQAKLLLGLFNDGYKVEELGCNRLVLGWKSRQLLSASIWTSSSEPNF